MPYNPKSDMEYTPKKTDNRWEEEDCQEQNLLRTADGSGIYRKKEQKYQDLKSSASAFIMVGSLLLVFSLLCWFGIIRLPIAFPSRILFQTVSTLIGCLCIVVYAVTAASAKKLFSQAATENKQTEEIINWFTSSYTARQIDRKLPPRMADEEPEAASLKRLEIIQDILITQKDLPNQAYVDSLCEDIYTRLYD